MGSPRKPAILLHASLLLAAVAATADAQTISAVTNGASFIPENVSPGSIAVIWGSNLAGTTAQATGSSWPTHLAGVTVYLNGQAVPLYYVSATQIDFQVPYAALGNLPTSLAYVNVVGPTGSGNQFAFAISRTAPGIFTGAAGQAIAQNADYTSNSSGNPAATGSYVTVYLTGIGVLDNPVPDGNSAPNGPLSRSIAPFSATIGGSPANVSFVGLTPGFTGLAQANIQIPDLPAGSYPLVITVGNSASNAASITVAGGTQTRQFVLSSMVGDGATGGPSSGSFKYPAGTTESYSYAPASGFSAPIVEIDGTVSQASGSISMNSDHWLWAFGQPASGTDFSGFITTPNDPSIIPYPQFYMNRPSSLTIRVPDPHCALQSDVIAYPSSYLGSFSMPAISGAPLASGIARGVNFKDFWDPPNFGTATLNNGCSDSMHDAFTDSVARVKRMGADHLSVMNTPVLVDAGGNMLQRPVEGQAVMLNPTWPGAGIPESDLAFIVSTASQAGLDVWIDFQVCCIGDAPPSADWFSSFLDAYTQYVVQMAQLAEKYGVKSIMLNWGAWNDYSVTQFGDVYTDKLDAALSQIRDVYHGTVRLYDWGAVDITRSSAIALYKNVDAIQLEFDTPILSADENQNLTFSLVKQKYKHLFAGMVNQFVAAFPSQKIAFYALIQSHRNFLQTGWIEDAFCVNGCIQNTLQTDFSVQAIAYEALLEAAAESGIDFMSFDTKGYWYADNILPNTSFPNTAQSVRNKPAETILQRWYKK